MMQMWPNQQTNSENSNIKLQIYDDQFFFLNIRMPQNYVGPIPISYMSVWKESFSTPLQTAPAPTWHADITRRKFETSWKQDASACMDHLQAKSKNAYM